MGSEGAVFLTFVAGKDKVELEIEVGDAEDGLGNPPFPISETSKPTRRCNHGDMKAIHRATCRRKTREGEELEVGVLSQSRWRTERFPTSLNAQNLDDRIGDVMDCLRNCGAGCVDLERIEANSGEKTNKPPPVRRAETRPCRSR